MTTKKRCSERVSYDSWGNTLPCETPATVTENGKPYCKLHAPSEVARRRAEKDAAWTEENRREAEDKRKVAAFDDLLAALMEMTTLAGQATASTSACILSASGRVAAKHRAKAAIAKAKKES